ncbi:hypothetical protein LTR78_009822 [Recurvomyces mirabilis]|uniref:Uncharacterized protein n=1 Tax=Recurvomyces mirabilis TaxID=574656 RepID=A0AAE0WIG2_9PEZI|nr:hypothetical protein LTR78_009822 [Recurvomyces mirabilis]KAK5153058.1 hypothetical protein LTS14_007702 [Recurvomyces mirabilis]
MNAQLFSNTTSSRSSTAAPLSTSSIATAAALQSSTTSATLSTYGTSITDFPGATGLCCMLYPIGVGVNTWYEKDVSVITATVHSTFLDYNGTRTLNGTSTELAKGFDASAYFSTYPVLFEFGNVTRVSGIPNNLLPTQANLCGITSVQTATEVTFTAQNLTITSPTPFWYYPGGFMQTGYSSSGSCYTHSTDGTLLWSTTVNGTYYSSSYIPTSTAIVTKAFNPGGGSTEDITLDYAISFKGNVTEYMEGVVYAGIGQIEFDGFADWPGQEWAKDPLIVAQFASIGYCSDAGGLGEPTVHVAVNALTTDTTSVITMTDTPAPASPITTSVVTSLPVALPQSTGASVQTSQSSSSVAAPSSSSSTQIRNSAATETSVALPSSSAQQQSSAHTSASSSPNPTASTQSTQTGVQVSNLVSVIQSIAASSVPAAGALAGSSPIAAASSQTNQATQTAGGATTPAAPIGNLISAVQQAASSEATTISTGVGNFIASELGLSQANAQSSVLATTQAVIIVGSSAITANSASAFVIATQVVQLSPQVRQSSIQTTQHTAAVETLTASGQSIAFTPSSGALVLDSTTVQAGSVATISGQQISVASNGVVVVYYLPQTTITLVGSPVPDKVFTGVMTASGHSIAFSQSNGALALGSATVAPGSAAAVSGQIISLASNGIVNVNGSPQATIVSSGPASPSGATGVITAGSQIIAYSQSGPSIIVVGSQTISRGSATLTNGQTVSLAPNGVINVNGSPAATASVTGVSNTQHIGVLTVGSQTIGYTFSGSEAVVGSQTLSPDSTIVVGGETLTLGPQNSQILVISDSKTVSTLGIAGISSAIATSHPPGSTASMSAASAPAASSTLRSAAVSTRPYCFGAVLPGVVIAMLICILL